MPATIELLIGEDVTSCCLVNAGVFCVRVSEWSLQLWRDVWASAASRKFHNKAIMSNQLCFASWNDAARVSILYASFPQLLWRACRSQIISARLRVAPFRIQHQ